MKQNHLLTSLIVLMTLSHMELHGQDQKAVPRLVVSILVEQLGTDYIEAFAPLYGEDGFKALLEKGRVYEQATYPTKHPDRATAAAVLASGAAAFDNGIIANGWWDRQLQRPINAVDDNSHQGINTTQGSSPIRLQVSTFSDELKMATEGKAIVYAIAPSRETAVLTAGHAADGALWIDDVTGQWASTAYYGPLPQWVKSASSLSATAGASQVWTPIDAVVGRFTHLGGGGTKEAFKHKFEGNTRYKDYKTSGLINDNVAEMVRHCLSHTTMGRDEVTDYLSITLNANTYRHAPIEQVSMELQDTYVRLDAALAKILRHIDKHIGMSNTLVVMTSTGGQHAENSNYAKYRIPTGTVDMPRVSHLLNVYLMALYGNGQYVEGTYGRDIYLNHKLLDQKNVARHDIYKKAEEFLLQFSGIKSVYGLYATPTAENANLKKGYNSNVSGDLIIGLRAGWNTIDEATGHKYYAQEAVLSFPIIFYGASITPQRLYERAPVEAIAPTLTKGLRIRAPNSSATAPLRGM